MYWKSQYAVAVNATSQRQKGKEMEKENKTVQEKKVQRMVNDLIKMAERRGATYYGSWIEDREMTLKAKPHVGYYIFQLTLQQLQHL